MAATASMMHAPMRTTETIMGVSASPGMSALSLTGGTNMRTYGTGRQHLNRHNTFHVDAPYGVATVFTKVEDIRVVAQDTSGKTEPIQVGQDGRIQVLQQTAQRGEIKDFKASAPPSQYVSTERKSAIPTNTQVGTPGIISSMPVQQYLAGTGTQGTQLTQDGQQYMVGNTPQVYVPVQTPITTSAKTGSAQSALI